MSFPYNTAEKESVSCSFCRGTHFLVLSKEGQDKLPLTTVMCRRCGLIFINPRMTAKWYFEYYQHEYRAKSIEHGGEGRLFDLKALFHGQKEHGMLLVPLLQNYIRRGASILEVGSSAGGVLRALHDAFGSTVVGIEPSGPEVSYAEKEGVKTYPYLMEEIDEKVPTLSTFDVILCTQSLNHLLDPRFFFEWSYRHLVKDGLLVLEVMNFRHQLKKAGRYRNAVKIDHPYMFTPEALHDFVTSAGFDVLYIDSDEKSATKKHSGNLPDTHVRLIAKKTSRKPFADLRIGKRSLFYRLSLNKTRIYLYYLLRYRIPAIVKKHFA